MAKPLGLWKQSEHCIRMHTCSQTKNGTHLLLPQGRALHLLWREQTLHPEIQSIFPSLLLTRCSWQFAQSVLSGLTLVISKGGPISECLRSNIASETEQHWSSTCTAPFFLITGWGGGSKEWQRTLDYAVICWASLANIQYVSSEEDELHYYEINWEEKGADTELFQTISRISKDGLLNCRWGFKSIVLVSFHHFWLEWITMLFNLKPDPLQNSQGLTMEVLVVAFQSSFSHSAASYIAWKHFASRLIL